MTRTINLLALSLAVSSASMGVAQNSQSYLNDIGSPAYSVNLPVENGFINVSNGNLHLEFPLASPPQRGALSVSERLVYDSRIWMFSPFGNHGSYHWWPYNVPGTSTTSGGWQLVKSNEIGTVSYTNFYENDTSCGEYHDDGSDSGLMDYYSRSNIVWTDPSGTVHNFSALEVTDNNECSGSSNIFQGVQGGLATDGSGYSITSNNTGDVTVIDGNGTQVYPNIIDRFGNYLSADGQGNLMDSGGRVPVIATNNGNVTYYDVLAPNGPINNNGMRVRYTVTSASVPVATQFNQSDTYEWNPSTQYLTPVQSIGLPDGTQYSFSYDSYGGLSSMTLPTGGVVTYGYSNFVDSSNTSNRWLASRIVDNGTTTITPSVVASCQNYSNGCVEQVNVHKPSGDETVYQLTINNGAWNTGTSVYAGPASSGQQLSNQTAVNTYTNGCAAANCSGANYLSQSLSTTTLFPTGVRSQSQSLFNATTGKPSAVKEWDFIASGQTFSSAPTRETDYAYIGYDPQQVTVVDQSGQRVSQTTYSYTSTATTTSGITQHGTANAGGPYLQTVSQWINTTGATLDQTSSLDDTGTLLSSTDPNGTTTYGHDGTNIFTTSTNLPVPASGVALMTSATYDINSGALLTQTDPNGTKTVYSGFDALSRPTEIDVQDSNSNLVAQTNYSYGTNGLGVHQYQTSGDTETQYDAYGRPSRTAVFNGQGSSQWYQQDVCYDSSGRANFQSTRYQGNGWATTKVCSGNNAGTTTTYDALGRPSSTTNADGTAQYLYAGRAVKQTDVNGVQKVSQTDAFGRTTAVCEISSNTLAGSSPVDCGMDIPGTGYLTSYVYDLANHTTTVNQGVQSRTFKTDSLGRSVFTSEPERGVTTYSYLYNSTGLQVSRVRPLPNQTSPSNTVTTTTQYDSVGRVLSTVYSDGITPRSDYAYDTPNWAEAGQQTNLKGRLSLAQRWTPAGITGTLFSYDPKGNILFNYECVPSGCGNGSRDIGLFYSYDFGGALTSQSDGAGATYTYARSPAGEVTGITSSLSDPNNPTNIVVPSSVQNGPFGPINYSLGNGTNQVKSYDSLGRNNNGWLCNNQSTAPQCGGPGLLYGYSDVWSGSRLSSSLDTAVAQQRTYGYDEFNRLASTNINNAQTYQYQYDRWGNRLQQNAPQGGTQTTLNFNASNQVTGTGNVPNSFIYDAAGNLRSDGTYTYNYDPDGNLTSVTSGGQTTTYTYDSLNRRVKIQGSAGVYEVAFDINGRRSSTWVANGPLSEAQIYWDGQPIGYRSVGATHFQHQDWLGTERTRTNASASMEGSYSSLPFGDSYSSTGTDADQHHFAGLDYDSESGTHHALFRQYSSVQGRWMSPDPYDGSMNFGNPQSFNRYNYVLNNPVRFTDPTGLDCHGDPTGCGGGGGGGEDECGVICTGVTLGLNALIGEIASLLHHPAFHASVHARPGGTQFMTASYNGPATASDGTYTLHTYEFGSTIPSGPGPFTYSGTIAQFLTAASSAGLTESVLDEDLGFHKGLQLRTSSNLCNLHVTDVLQNGSPTGQQVNGRAHFDLFNPIPSAYDLFNPGYYLGRLTGHAAFDYGADEAYINSRGLPTLGDRTCR